LLNFNGILDAKKTITFVLIGKFKKMSDKHVVNFDEFLKTNSKKSSDLDFNIRKEKWVIELNSVYTNIRKWLSEYKNEGLRIEEISVTIREQLLSDYKAKKMLIFIGLNHIEIKPIGTFILGSLGRLDMIGRKGEYMIILSDWGKWKLVNKIEKKSNIDFNKENFLNTIQEIY
jgi:hypothetical protein